MFQKAGIRHKYWLSKLNYELNFTDSGKLEKKFWFEDEHGNEVSEDNPNACYYRRCFPLELHQVIDEYCYHPKNPIIKFFCRKSRRFDKWISKGKQKTFRTILDCTTTYGSGQECIVAMVNSGDYTLGQAIWIYANACERCMNVLLYKYLDGKDGYAEFSEEWKKANTECGFCKGDSH